MSHNKVSDRGGRRWYGRKNLAIWFCVATVVCITIWAYRPALDAPWILDDARNIVDSPALRWTELSIENVKAVLDSALLRTRPVANFSFGIDHMFWGLEPRGFHATNIAIHLAVGLAKCLVCDCYVWSAHPAKIDSRGIAGFSARSVVSVASVEYAGSDLCGAAHGVHGGAVHVDSVWVLSRGEIQADVTTCRVV